MQLPAANRRLAFHGLPQGLVKTRPRANYSLSRTKWMELSAS